MHLSETVDDSLWYSSHDIEWQQATEMWEVGLAATRQGDGQK